MAATQAAVPRRGRSRAPEDAPPAARRFLAVSLAVSWVIWVPLAVVRLAGANDSVPTESLVLYAFPGVVVPAVAGVALTGRAGGRRAVRRLLARLSVWRVGVLPWAAVVVVQPVLLLLAVVIAAAAGIDPPAVTEDAHQVASLVTTSVLLLVAALGEELGWRGLALPSLQVGRSPMVASMVLGGAVAVWHLPYWALQGVLEEFGAIYVVLDLLFVVALTFQLTWVFNRAAGSVLLPVVLHLVFNLVNVAVVPVTASTPTFAVLTALEWGAALTVLRPEVRRSPTRVPAG